MRIRVGRDRSDPRRACAPAYAIEPIWREREGVAPVSLLSRPAAQKGAPPSPSGGARFLVDRTLSHRSGDSEVKGEVKPQLNMKFGSRRQETIDTSCENARDTGRERPSWAVVCRKIWWRAALRALSHRRCPSAFEGLVVMSAEAHAAVAERVHRAQSIGNNVRGVCVSGHTVPTGTTWPRSSRPVSVKALDVVS